MLEVYLKKNQFDYRSMSRLIALSGNSGSSTLHCIEKDHWNFPTQIERVRLIPQRKTLISTSVETRVSKSK